MLTLDSTVRRTDGLLETEIEGEIALMSPEIGNYFSLNSTGSVIWKSLASDIRIENLIEEIVAVYKVDRLDCKNEVIQLLEKFAELGLLQVES